MVNLCIRFILYYRTKGIVNQVLPFSSAPENLRFAASVAEFGMLLRESEFKANASYAQVLENAGSALGLDVEGYRKEFINLVKKAEELHNRDLSKTSSKY